MADHNKIYNLHFYTNLLYLTPLIKLGYKPDNKSTGDAWFPIDLEGMKKRLEIVNNILKEMQWQ